MKPLPSTQTPAWPLLAWLSAALAGVAAPVLAMVWLADASAPAPLVGVAGPIMALGLMGVAMIAAAVSGRLWIGVVLALMTGAGLAGLAITLGLPALPHLLSTGLAMIIASVSFAARGALFARSGLDKGWLIALFVVAGEAAVLLTAAAQPETLPDWLLVLLPAQWASAAIQASLSGAGAEAAWPSLIALAGTAAATWFVVRLWPRRWTYLIMFTAWLSLSALVWQTQAAAKAAIEQPRVALQAP